ncbi:MAG: sigma-70 family RNA polymerase sigma factor [Planctomycetota bacterium]
MSDSVFADQDALLEGLRAEDDDAATHFVSTHSGRMLSTARRILGDEHDAHDAVQDAFISAFRAINDFDGRSQLGTWLHRIVVNAALGRLRKRKRTNERRIEDLQPRFDDTGKRVVSLESWTPGEESKIAVDERQQAVRRALDELPPDFREIVILRDVIGMDTATTAQQLDISEPAVKTRLHRARLALRELLQEAFGDV